MVQSLDEDCIVYGLDSTCAKRNAESCENRVLKITFSLLRSNPFRLCLLHGPEYENVAAWQYAAAFFAPGPGVLLMLDDADFLGIYPFC